MSHPAKRQLTISLEEDIRGTKTIYLSLSRETGAPWRIHTAGLVRGKNLPWCTLIAACAVAREKGVSFSTIKTLPGWPRKNGRWLKESSIKQYIKDYIREEFDSARNGILLIDQSFGVFLPSEIDVVLELDEEWLRAWLNSNEQHWAAVPSGFKEIHPGPPLLQLQEPFSQSESDIFSPSRPLPQTGPHFFGREEDLRKLDAAWEDPFTSVVSLVGWGGVGKTALINEWLQVFKRKNHDDVQVLTWSFAGQGSESDDDASDDEFMTEALTHFRAASGQSKSPQDRAAQLAEHIRQRRTLLILDGLEPLQDREGRLKTTAVGKLLDELAGKMNGLCLISTRPPFKHFARWGNSILTLPLGDLSPAACIKLLRSLDVEGEDQELEQAAKEYGYHALALTLLGRLLVIQHRGRIQSRDSVNFTDQELHEGRQVAFIMSQYDKILNNLERAIMRLLSIFDRSVSKKWLSAFFDEPIIAQVSEAVSHISDFTWNTTTRALQEARLLTVKKKIYEILEVHPLVRAYYNEKFFKENPVGYRLAQGRLYEYFRDSAKQDAEILTITDLEPLYQAIWHGTKSGRHAEAYTDVYYNRIRRGNEYFSYEKLGAISSDLAALACFFEKKWTSPAAELSRAQQVELLSEAGAALKALGRTAEAREATKSAFAIYEAAQDWTGAATELSDLASIERQLDLAEALRIADKALMYRIKGKDELRLPATLSGRALTLHLQGKVTEAGIEFEKVRQMLQNLSLPERIDDKTIMSPVGCNIAAYRICQHWLDVGEFLPAFKMATQWFEQKKKPEKLLSIALHRISLARSWQAQGDYDQAEDYFNRAIEALHVAGRDDQLMKGLLYRAGNYLDIGDYIRAELDIKKVQQFSEYNNHNLLSCDALLLAARRAAKEGDVLEARRCREEARLLMEAIGYYLRRQECNADL